MLWDQKEKMAREMYIDIFKGNNGVEKKTGILYNDTVQQLKGM